MSLNEFLKVEFVLSAYIVIRLYVLSGNLETVEFKMQSWTSNSYRYLEGSFSKQYVQTSL